MSMLLENIKVNRLIVKILFYSYISTYSFYKIKTNDFTLNDAYTYPIKYYFLLDIIPYIYNKDYIYIFHHLTGMFFLNYKPIHLYRFYNKLIILSLSTEVSNIFLKLIYLKIRTKVVKVCFIITFLYNQLRHNIYSILFVLKKLILETI